MEPPVQTRSLLKGVEPEEFVRSWDYWDLPDFVYAEMPHIAQFHNQIPVMVVGPAEMYELLLKAIQEWERVNGRL